jgi:hypothetical protein
MGQAPLGWRDADDAEVYDFGYWALLGSGSLYGDGDVRALNAHRDETDADDNWYWQRGAGSGVVVLDR